MYWKLKVGVSIAIALSLIALCGCRGAGDAPQRSSGFTYPLSVRALSDDRPSLLFSENEPVHVKALVKGGMGPVQVEYAVEETCGDWFGKGVLEMPRKDGEAAEAKLPLSLPGRGHFKLNLLAKCGGLAAKDSTAVAIVYQPLPADVASPWGIMYIVCRWLPPGLNPKDAPAYIAESMRMMGASWTRLNLWESTYKVKVEEGNVVLDLSSVRRQVDEFRKRGINILGEFVQTPRVLSSKPDAKETKVDAGPLYCRVKPADYRLWDQMVEKIAKEFKDDIPVWEVWNEVDYAGAYWAGTKEEFLELLDHTSAAIRKGNPSAKVAAAGFTNKIKACAPFFDAGFGKNIDILSVHYTDRKDIAGDFLKLEREHGLTLPIVNTEEASVIPLNNLARGIRSFKFIHMHDTLPIILPLMRTDWKISPAAVTYSVGARLIGSRKFQRTKDFPGFKAYFFGDEGDIVAIAASSGASVAKLMGRSIAIDRILVKTTPVEGRDVIGIDALGRERKLPDGAGEIPFPLEASLFNENKEDVMPECVFFIRGCKDIASVEGIVLSNKDAIVVEAESGDFDRKAVGVSEDKEFSGGKYLNIYKRTPGEKGYGADLKVSVPFEGNYHVCFSGNNLNRLKKPSSVSPFLWCFDDGPKKLAGEKPLKVIDWGIEGAPEGLSELGIVHLTKGEHIFQLRLAAPRETPDNAWALWFDAIALIPAQ